MSVCIQLQTGFPFHQIQLDSNTPAIRLVRDSRGDTPDEELGAGELEAADGVAGGGVLVGHDGDVAELLVALVGVVRLEEVAVLVALLRREAVPAPVVRAAEHVAHLVGGDDALGVCP